MDGESARTRLNRFKQLVQDDPATVVGHTDEIKEYIYSENDETRRQAMELTSRLAMATPLEIPELVPACITRLDDIDDDIRCSALQASYHLAGWYPDAFVTATDVITASLEARARDEQIYAVMTLSQIAVQRPDLVTPRKQALAKLEELSSQVDFAEQVRRTLRQEDRWETENLVADAITALRGSDLASRPLEADLASTPRSTKLSKPARVGIQSFVWGAVLIPLLLVLPMIILLRLVWRYRHLTPGQRLAALGWQAKKLKFFVKPARATLYLRSSYWPTPTQIVPLLPGRSPTSDNWRVQTGELPDDWHVIARRVRQRDGYRCRNCGRGGGPNGTAELHIDHQTPRSRHGSNHPTNLRTLCRSCHEARHARTFESG